MTVSIGWNGVVTATSSIAHGGETRASITLLRREQVRLPDGRAVFVPLVSGNAVRGSLRRVGEEMLRDVLHYEGLIPLSAAHVLRGGGGAITRTTNPLSGARLRDVRALVPQLAVFGGAVGRPVDGALQVGKLLPHVAETAHLTGHQGPDIFTATQVETYTSSNETTTSGFHALLPEVAVPLDGQGGVDLEALAALDSQSWSDSGPMIYRIETFPAGTKFSTWLRLERTSELAAAFFGDVLQEWTRRGRIGGRSAIGHGDFTADWTPDVPVPDMDWRAELTTRRDDALEAIRALA